MTNSRELSRTEILLARTLSYGTWISTGVILIGLAMAFAGGPSTAVRSNTAPGTGTGAMRVVSAGVALLILLPTFRVVLMLGAFVRQRDYRFAAFAGIVFTIIILGFELGAKMAHGAG